MIRATLKECIDLFDSNVICQQMAIRGMEQLGEWSTAEKYWKKLGAEDDAKACKMIADAISKGDSYRDAVRHLNNWVDKTVEDGIMSKADAVKTIYPEMDRIHKTYYY